MEIRKKIGNHKTDKMVEEHVEDLKDVPIIQNSGQVPNDPEGVVKGASVGDDELVIDAEIESDEIKRSLEDGTVEIIFQVLVEEGEYKDIIAAHLVNPLKMGAEEKSNAS